MCAEGWPGGGQDHNLLLWWACGPHLSGRAGGGAEAATQSLLAQLLAHSLSPEPPPHPS